MIQTNIMVLGQTGVGKSTLINYLYGEEKVKVGTGKPVTGRGDFQQIRVESPTRPGVYINIWDSWGLESDKAEDWKQLIGEKLSSKLSYADMISGIVYCISYSNDRIQTFEIEILKDLLNKGYKVIIVLTNADNTGYEQKKLSFRKKLDADLSDFHELYTIVDICAFARPKIGQKKENVHTFGRDELFIALEHDRSDNIQKVFLVKLKEWEEDSHERLNNLQYKVKEDIKWISEEEVKKEAKYAIERLNELARKIFDKIKNTTEEHFSYQEETMGSFSSSMNDLLPSLEDKRSKFWRFLSKYIPLICLPLICMNLKLIKNKVSLMRAFDEDIKRIESKIIEVYNQAVETHIS